MAPSGLTHHKAGPGRSPLPAGKVTGGVSLRVRPRVGRGRGASGGLLRHSSTQRPCPGSSLRKGSQPLRWATIPRPSGGLAPSSELRAVTRFPISGRALPEGDPRQADLGRSCTLIPMKLLSQKSNPSCVRSALGQAGAHSSVTLKLRLRCGRKPHVPMLPERDWDLGLRVPVRKKLLSPQELQTESW